MALLKNLDLIKKIKIEEAVLACVSLFFLTPLLLSGFFNKDWEIILKTSWTGIKSSFNWWAAGLPIIIGFFILRIYYHLLANRFDKKQIPGAIKSIFFLARPLIAIYLTAAIGILTTGVIYRSTKDRLMNMEMLNVDKAITSGFPLMWLHSPLNALKEVFDFLTPAIIFSFMSLGIIMGVVGLVFYLWKNKKICKKFIISLFISFAFSMPLWYFFPANSPTNAFLYSQNNLNAELTSAISNYRPNDKVEAFQEKNWQAQKNAMPVTTMPSMHWAWSITIVFYLFKMSSKTLILSAVWLILDLFGTIYLGNHYLIDGLIALPLTALSLFLADKLVRIETRYLEEDDDEDELREKIRNWIIEPFSSLKQRLSK